MEKPLSNPNEALTPYYAGETMVYVPVIEYYLYAGMKPEEALARIALARAQEEQYVETVEEDD